MGNPTDSQQRITRAFSDVANRTLSAPEQLIEAFYPELKRLAASKMRRQTADHPCNRRHWQDR